MTLLGVRIVAEREGNVGNQDTVMSYASIHAASAEVLNGDLKGKQHAVLGECVHSGDIVDKCVDGDSLSETTKTGFEKSFMDISKSPLIF